MSGGFPSFNDSYITGALKKDSPLARASIEAVFNQALVGANKQISFDKFGYNVAPRKYSSEYTGGIQKELDIVLNKVGVTEAAVSQPGDDVVVMRLLPTLGTMTIDLEVESSRTVTGGGYKYLGYAIAASEPREDGTRIAPRQCVLILHLQRKGDPDKYECTVKYDDPLGSEIIISYSVPVVYLSEDVRGTIFEPYYWQEVMVHQPLDSDEFKESYSGYCASLVTVSANLEGHPDAESLIQSLIRGLNHRCKCDKNVTEEIKAIFDKEETDMEYILSHGRPMRKSLADEYFEKIHAARKEGLEEGRQEGLCDAVKKLICKGQTQEELTECFGRDIWTTEMLTYYAIHSPHVGDSKAFSNGVSHMNLRHTET